jgi:hypothetical protein
MANLACLDQVMERVQRLLHWRHRVEGMPMKGFSPSARSWTISAAVCPFAAQCILFCMQVARDLPSAPGANL